MDNRRLALVAGLGIVELWIVGLMARSVSGGHGSGFSTSAANLPYAASGAGGSRMAKTLETGPSPHVVIDDEDATLAVTVRAGTTVSLTEESRADSWVRGDNRPATMEKTDDGVRIARPSGGLVVSIGSVRRQLGVVVPPGAHLDVENAGSTTVAGLRADATVHSDDGSIVVTDVRGALDIKTDDGRIELHDVAGPSIAVNSDNGRIVFDAVRADEVAVSTDNGRIEVARSLLRGGKIETDSGRIALGLDARSDVTVNARASSGRVSALPPLSVSGGDDDDAPAVIRVGNGSGRLEVGSDDGSITVSAVGV
jgi:hypothetical protein